MAQADDDLLYRQWTNGLKLGHISHQRAAASYELRGRAFGIPAIVATTSVGAALVTDGSNHVLLAAAGMLSFAAAILTALQTFLDYPAKAERHHRAGRAYGELRRRAEQALMTVNRATVHSEMTAIRDAWSALEKDEPCVAQRFHDEARKQIKPAVANGGFA